MDSLNKQFVAWVETQKNNNANIYGVSASNNSININNTSGNNGEFYKTKNGEIIWVEAGESPPSGAIKMTFDELKELPLEKLWKIAGLKTINVEFGFKITLGATLGGNIGKYFKTGVFADLFSVTLVGYENGNWIFPGNRHLGYTQFNQGISGGAWILSAEANQTFDAGLKYGGYTNSKANYQVGLGKRTLVGEVGPNLKSDGQNSRIGTSLEAKIGFILGFQGVLRIE
jgi:hypothetical protein